MTVAKIIFFTVAKITKERVAASLITDDVIPTSVDLYTTEGGVGGCAGQISFSIILFYLLKFKLFWGVRGGKRVSLCT